MTRLGIIICGRYQSCGGANVSGPCGSGPRLRPLSKDEPVEIVGFSSCGGCPGGNIESVPRR